MSHDFLSIYDAKLAEYLLAVSYLLLFVPFWKYVQSARGSVAVTAEAAAAVVRSSVEIPAAARPAAARRAPAARPAAGWFSVPNDVYLHPGHTWARLEADGTVVAVNPAARDAHGASADPYGTGWLFKVKPAKLSANLRQLYQGSAAKKLLDDAAELLALRADPQMAVVLQDGGAPVHGIAAALAGDDWDSLAREILRS